MNEGWRGAGGTAALGAVLVLVAGLVDAPAFYVPGIALLLLGAVSTIWVRQVARGVSVARELQSRRVVEGEPMLVEVSIRSGRLPPPAGQLRDPLLRAPVVLSSGRRATTVRIRTRFARRGRRRLPPPQVRISDPLGLAGRTVSAAGEVAEVLVLPRIEPVLAPAASGDGVAGIGGQPALAAEVELDGIRAHRPGTPAARIAWPIYARRGELHDRVMRADADSRPLVVLDLRGTRVESDLDAAVRAAASLTIHLARRGGCAVLLPGERRPHVVDDGLRGWQAAYTRLALAEDGHGPALGGVGPRTGVLIWVAAGSLNEAPRELARASAGSRVLVVPGTLSGRAASFSVAGCNGYRLDGRRSHYRPAAVGSARP